MADVNVICANRQCRIAYDGKCLEGYEDLGKCPYHGKEPEYEEDEEGDAESAVDTFDGLHLSDGLPLGSTRADAVLAIRPTRMVGVIGVHDCGKTSVIAGMYDLFQMGPIADVSFAGSSTLRGFEMICHDARVASERSEPHSERTKRGDVEFYHVDVLCDGQVLSLLIADRSGEEYEEVGDLAANASLMFELRRADVITILVDGVRLASPVDRADAMGSIRLIIQGMVENDAFSRKPNVAIVLTKNDAVQASPKKDRIEQDFRAIVDGIRLSFAAYFGELESFVTSASPKGVNVNRGHGLAAVLEFWLKPSAEPKATRQHYYSGRVFDSLPVEEIKVG